MNTSSSSFHPIVSAYADRWWAVVLRGLAAVLFGLIAIARPAAGLLALVFVWGVYAIIDGLLSLASAVRAGRAGRSWGWLVFEGIIGIAAGVVAFAWPGITAFALVLVIAFWAVINIKGVAEIFEAYTMRHVIEHEWLLAASGVLSILFGIVLFVFPRAGAYGVAMLIGAYAILFGALMVGLGIRLERWRHPRTPPMGAHPVT